MGRTQLVVLSQPDCEDISRLEQAVARSLEVAPIELVDALVLTKDANDEIGFQTISDIGNPDRAWRGLIARAFFGSGAARPEPWNAPTPLDEPDELVELTQELLWEISDRIPRQSSVLIVLVEHIWMDELYDVLTAPGRLIATGWISIGKLMEMGNGPQPRNGF
jgi:hypothetical protein